jgi:hypothetical protein
LPEQRVEHKKETIRPTMLPIADLNTAYNTALEAMKELQRHGVRYEQLEREFYKPQDQKLLRGLGVAAGLLKDDRNNSVNHQATESQPKLALKTGPKPVVTGTALRLPGLTVATRSDSSSASPTMKVSPAPSANRRVLSEVDRKNYLDRLAAAKKKSISAGPSPLMATAPAPPSVPAQPLATPQAPSREVPSQHSATAQDAGPEAKPTSKADSVPNEAPPLIKTNLAKTDLVRQRLDALKRQAALKEGNSPKSPPKEMDASGLNDLVSPSLPGLTTTSLSGETLKTPTSPVKSALSQSSESISERARLLSSLEPTRPGLRKRPVSADFLDTTTSKKPYVGPIVQEDETCVIELSEDESEGEIDEDEPMTDETTTRIERSFMPLTAPRPYHVPRIPNPGFKTPDSLREATQTLEAERRALLDRIARAEKRQREKASNAPTPAETPSGRSPLKEESASSPAVEPGPSNTGLDSYQIKLKEQAALDAVVSSNESKMEELRRQMQALEEETRQKVQDRSNLARELERLGVDTVGMSHTDLQATKDRIEHQNDVAMDTVRTEAGAEAGPAEDLAVARPISRDDASVKRSELEDGEWPSSEMGNSPPEIPLPLTSHPVDLPGRPMDMPVALEEPPQYSERPHTADTYNSLSTGEIMEDDAMVLDNDDPEQEIIQGPSTADVSTPEEVSAAEGRPSTDESGDEDYEPELTINDSAPAEPPLALHAAKARQAATESETSNVTQETETARFTPYESPLKLFRAYRNHSSFLSEVPHGYQSVTFLNKANPRVPLCDYEAGGGSCRDPACKNQHFKDMVLSGASTAEASAGSQPRDPPNSSTATSPRLHTDFGLYR